MIHKAGGIQIHLIQKNKYYMSPLASEVDLPSDHPDEDELDGRRNPKGSSEKFSSENEAAFLGTYKMETPRRQKEGQFYDVVVLAPQYVYSLSQNFCMLVSTNLRSNII